MRTITFIGLLLIIVTGLTPTYAQYTEFIGDTIELDLSGYNAGQIQWQFSQDKQNWKDIEGATKETINAKHSILFTFSLFSLSPCISRTLKL